MRVNHTWTISFENDELARLSSEINFIGLPSDLGWKPILGQVAATRQITLPLRAIERLSLELDITRSRFVQRASWQDYKKKFPMIASLSCEVDAILNFQRKSA
ncbi:MAG: hypothetical protein AB1489_03265 [Acidobacteriota bacterium]